MRSLRFTNLVKNKRVLLRLDLNVPLKRNKILDNTKIIKSLETIKYIQEQNPKMLTIMSHLGRPKYKYDSDLIMKPIANELSNLLNQEILYKYSNKVINPNISICLLENLRFHKGEEDNDNNFARKLAFYGDIYVNDAFAVSHRHHASVSKIYNHFPSGNIFNGFIIEKEKKILDMIRNNKEKPYVVILGGNKLGDKINAINGFLEKADKILIGGALSYCFLKAKGYEIGCSPCQDNDVILAKQLLDKDVDNKLVLRKDNIVSCLNPLYNKNTPDENIPIGFEAFDIGCQTVALFNKHLRNSKIIFWNGPLGLCEIEEYSKGTLEILKTLCHSNKKLLVIGGGESASLLKNLHYPMKHVEVVTGGGASLEYLTKGKLHGLI